MTLALYDWVEKGHAPDRLIATRYGEDEGDRPRDIAFQRPLCAWPREPVYRGGDTTLAASFTCAVAKE